MQRLIPSDQDGLTGMLTGKMQEEIAEEYPGDPATVRAETRGLVLGTDEFQRQVDAVVAVAEGADAAGRTW